MEQIAFIAGEELHPVFKASSFQIFSYKIEQIVYGEIALHCSYSDIF